MRTPFVIAISVAAVAVAGPSVAGVPVASVHALETVAPAEPPSDPEPWIADFEGIEIDLRDGWDGAKACLTDGIETECWDTEAEMIAAAGALAAPQGDPGAPPDGSGFARASCSSFLRLYTGTSFTGNVLGLSTRYTLLNLSGYGFNNVTSSYRVGACPAAFYDLSNGGAPQYGGATWAGASATSMLAGWDNRVSSVYIG